MSKWGTKQNENLFYIRSKPEKDYKYEANLIMESTYLYKSIKVAKLISPKFLSRSSWEKILSFAR